MKLGSSGCSACSCCGYGRPGRFSRLPQNTDVLPLETVSAGTPKAGWSCGSSLILSLHLFSHPAEGWQELKEPGAMGARRGNFPCVFYESDHDGGRVLLWPCASNPPLSCPALPCPCPGPRHSPAERERPRPEPPSAHGAALWPQRRIAPAAHGTRPGAAGRLWATAVPNYVNCTAFFFLFSLLHKPLGFCLQGINKEGLVTFICVFLSLYRITVMCN